MSEGEVTRPDYWYARYSEKPCVCAIAVARDAQTGIVTTWELCRCHNAGEFFHCPKCKPGLLLDKQPEAEHLDKMVAPVKLSGYAQPYCCQCREDGVLVKLELTEPHRVALNYINGFWPDLSEWECPRCSCKWRMRLEQTSDV